MPRLDMDVETSEVQDPIAPRREVLRPLPRHSLAAQDKEAMAIGHDENRHIVGLSGLAPEGRENDLSLIFRGIDHVLAEDAYVVHNHSQRLEIPICCPDRTSYELHLPAMPFAIEDPALVWNRLLE